ncbi:helix-turn-helix transcriptional regulator [Streptomyces griseofuscus]|uniref:helix-turn-helix domain-containing protein n=1 Tax=Streptomyces griseofuscus TaxID=146922 RepID=UPI0033E96F24
MAEPTVRTRRLGSELRRLRDAKGLTLEDVAERTGFPASKVSRIEVGRLGVKPGDLTALLTLYGLAEDAEERAVLAAFAVMVESADGGRPTGTSSSPITRI